MRESAPTDREPQKQADCPATVRSWVDLPMTVATGHVAARMFTFRGLLDDREHVALGLGNYSQPHGGTPLVRMHSECLTGDVFGSRRCDCGPQLEESMAMIARHGGYLLYLRQEGRGIGLYAKIEAYRLQERGMDTYQANRALGFSDDGRDYRVAALMLGALGVRRIHLVTGNPDKVSQLVDHGIAVCDVRRTRLHETRENVQYLRTKKAVGHLFTECEA